MSISINLSFLGIKLDRERFVLFKAEKLMLYARQINTGKSMRSIVEKDYKQTITHPLDVKEVPDYDEGG